MDISQGEVSRSVSGNSDEDIVPNDVGVTSDVGKDLWGGGMCCNCRGTIYSVLSPGKDLGSDRN